MESAGWHESKDVEADPVPFVDRHKDDGEKMILTLVCEEASLSESQQEYQRARVTPSGISNLLFYKDATPRAEHFLMCTIKVLHRELWPEKIAIPLKISLCYEDGTAMPSADQQALRILSLSSHVRAAIPAGTDTMTFSYRIELGSFRRADRSFALKIELAQDSIKQSIPNDIEVEPVLTKPVYVLSKKKAELAVGDEQSAAKAGFVPRKQQSFAAPVSFVQGYSALPALSNAYLKNKRKHAEVSPSGEGVLGDGQVPKRLSPEIVSPVYQRAALDSVDLHMLQRIDVLESRVVQLTSIIQSLTSAMSMPRDVSIIDYGNAHIGVHPQYLQATHSQHVMMSPRPPGQNSLQQPTAQLHAPLSANKDIETKRMLTIPAAVAQALHAATMNHQAA